MENNFDLINNYKVRALFFKDIKRFPLSKSIQLLKKEDLQYMFDVLGKNKKE